MHFALKRSLMVCALRLRGVKNAVVEIVLGDYHAATNVFGDHHAATNV